MLPLIVRHARQTCWKDRCAGASHRHRQAGFCINNVSQVITLAHQMSVHAQVAEMMALQSVFPEEGAVKQSPLEQAALEAAKQVRKQHLTKYYHYYVSCRGGSSRAMVSVQTGSPGWRHSSCSGPDAPEWRCARTRCRARWAASLLALHAAAAVSSGSPQSAGKLHTTVFPYSAAL